MILFSFGAWFVWTHNKTMIQISHGVPIFPSLRRDCAQGQSTKKGMLFDIEMISPESFCNKIMGLNDGPYIFCCPICWGHISFKKLFQVDTTRHGRAPWLLVWRLRETHRPPKFNVWEAEAVTLTRVKSMTWYAGQIYHHLYNSTEATRTTDVVCGLFCIMFDCDIAVTSMPGAVDLRKVAIWCWTVWLEDVVAWKVSRFQCAGNLNSPTRSCIEGRFVWPKTTTTPAVFWNPGHEHSILQSAS